MKKQKIDTSYMVGKIRYVTCSKCGREVKGVGDTTVSAICSNCLVRMIPLPEPKGYVPTGRPTGWHWMSEFVDKDGNVYHKGKEQPKLFGSLPATKVKPKKKTKRRTEEQILIAIHKKKKVLIAKHEKKKAALKKAKLSKS